MNEFTSPEEWLDKGADDITESVMPQLKPNRSIARKSFRLLNTNTIMRTKYQEPVWAIPEYLPAGLTVLAGRQKLGKTWLAMDWAVAVATGGFAIGAIDCDIGDVLYIDMENGPRRIQKRIGILFPNERPNLSRLHWATETLFLNDGFIQAVDAWRQSVSDPRLIVIDVLTRIKPTGSGAQNSYERDYTAYSELQSWAIDKGIAVLALHHTRKGGADDPLEALSGSNGLPAVADTVFLLDRDSNGITLCGRGRDIPEKDIALNFEAGIWTLKGEAHEVHRSEQRAKILSVLLDANEPMTPNVIADVTAMKAGNVRRLLHKMANAGEAQKTGRGQYIHPENTHLVTEERQKGAPR